ncbi:uncharacterized protein LOC143048820 [Mytilus galloprovincialis]|uniref:uncharacterized protein LOC143048820 n=1 Tax=Mytilus galloprovincialis TaxID=29158 RepID=UPI003F7BFB6E
MLFFLCRIYKFGQRMDIIYYKVEEVQDLIEEATKLWEPGKASYVHMIGYKMEEVYQLIIGQQKEVSMETSQKLLEKIQMISLLYASMQNGELEIDKIRRIHRHVKDMISTLVEKMIDNMLEEEHELEVEEQRKGETQDELDENEPSNTESVLYQCAEENTDNFMSEWQKANQEVSHLLNRNNEIVVRATKLPQCDIPSMNFQPDIDGIVVELTSFAGITFPLTHISILRHEFIAFLAFWNS